MMSDGERTQSGFPDGSHLKPRLQQKATSVQQTPSDTPGHVRILPLNMHFMSGIPAAARRRLSMHAASLAGLELQELEEPEPLMLVDVLRLDELLMLESADSVAEPLDPLSELLSMGSTEPLKLPVEPLMLPMEPLMLPMEPLTLPVEPLMLPMEPLPMGVTEPADMLVGLSEPGALMEVCAVTTTASARTATQAFSICDDVLAARPSRRKKLR
jgi:hypothetical protein